MTREEIRAEREKAMRDLRRKIKDLLFEALLAGRIAPCPMCNKSDGHWGNCDVLQYEAHRLAVEGHYSGIA